MTALTKGRNTPESVGDNRVGPLAAAERLFVGAIAMRNAAGLLVAGQTAAGLVGIGCATAETDNRLGADSDLAAPYKPGTFRYANSAAGDEVTAADIGSLAYVVDDQTVAKTNGGATRSPAGFIDNVDAQGVWVRFDEALTNAG
ncbi:hypothetical protein [Parasedimentitalea huanghaiensis]|uniref:Bacteriophage lambda head decoration protein D n=1 Tax=Parasedimentitalea huanghaiensis TaxID=2682100 RepID=A0A6L6WI36_9RHOB|nr:hypothetical protein [Zongyanglinia huanghaiensis]MVO16848.1 hypothetical protein [Zongyanglinia huanghaiensis]